MDDDRLRRVEELFHAALPLDSSERDEFLSQAGDSDPQIVAQVRTLLQAHAQAGNFLDAGPACNDSIFSPPPDSLQGQQIAHFNILSLLGSGGMGEVYLAEDTRLRRKVAIKCLRAESLQADQANKRLLREARAAAHLEHPNICPIYEVREDAARVFIIMQYVEGEMLSRKIESRRLTLNDALDVAMQIAEALAAAHQRGVIHRDIKPQNVILSPQGQVKVLDFGLAKIIEPGLKSDAASHLDSVITEQSTIIGTPMYMSPEQARGLALDARSDLFSLGVLLYECVTGHQPFAGDSSAEALANVLRRVPERASTLNPAVPPQLDALLSKALAKEAGARYASASAMLAELRRIRSLLPLGSNLPRPPTSTLKTSRRAALLSWATPSLCAANTTRRGRISGRRSNLPANPEAAITKPAPACRSAAC